MVLYGTMAGQLSALKSGLFNPEKRNRGTKAQRHISYEFWVLSFELNSKLKTKNSKLFVPLPFCGFPLSMPGTNSAHKQNKSIIHKFGLTKLENSNIKALSVAAGRMIADVFLPWRDAKVYFL